MALSHKWMCRPSRLTFMSPLVVSSRSLAITTAAIPSAQADSSELLQRVRIILVNPEGPRNVGAAARAMANFGIGKLTVVWDDKREAVGAKHGGESGANAFLLSSEARMAAVHAVDLLERATVVKSIPEALEGVTRCLGTTARERPPPAPALEDLGRRRIRSLRGLQDVDAGCMQWLLEVDAKTESAILFGPESRGLSNIELQYAQRTCKISTHSSYPVMNLSHALAVVCYELYLTATQGLDKNADTAGEESPDPIASLKNVDIFWSQVEDILLESNFLLPQTKTKMMAKLRRIAGKAALTENELAILHSIVAQARYYWKQKKV